MARTVSKTETYLGYTILLVLVIIGGVIYLRQFQYNPAILTPADIQARISDQPTLSTSPSLKIIQYTPEGLKPLTPPETFGPENLSEKINGKAELYLSAGFVRLISQRLAAEKESGAWVEVFVYHMGSVQNSFAVYSLQHRYDAEKLDLGKFAYKTENAVFFVHGPYYVEIIASAVQERLSELMVSFGKIFVRQTKISEGVISELALFPSRYLNEQSFTLIPSDGFGFHRFNSIFTAQYTVGETELTAFLSQRNSPAEAAELVEAYTLFLLANGGTEVKRSLDIPGARLVEIMDTFELIFNHDHILAGVHEAETRDAAEKIAIMLKHNLEGAGR
ncbi:MAG: hypothetical protein PVF76_17575 [Syntrophobacterales bacterium]|jgi:hypothetical protein